MYKKLTHVATRPNLETPWQFQAESNDELDGVVGSTPGINASITNANQLSYTVILEFETEEAFNAFETAWNTSGPALEAYNNTHGITTVTTEE